MTRVRTGGRFLRLLLALMVALGAAGAVEVSHANKAHADWFVGDQSVKSDDGSYVTNQVGLGGDATRGWAITLEIYSTAMKTTLHAAVIFPNTYLTQPNRTYPTLYMLSGAGTNHMDWMSWLGSADALDLMAGRQVLTVMPEDGDAGLYVNWVGPSKEYPNAIPQWKTFHTQELPQILARGYRTNGINALVGLSDAGIGTIDYPADNPGLYKAAACFSCLYNWETPQGLAAEIAIENGVSDYVNNPFGDRVTQASGWAAMNPVNHIAAFKASGTKLWLCNGNGNPGPNDPNGFQLDSYVYEQTTLDQAQGFATKAKAAGIPLTTDFYGDGGHNWYAWELAFPNAWSTTLAPALGLDVNGQPLDGVGTTASPTPTPSVSPTTSAPASPSVTPSTSTPASPSVSPSKSASPSVSASPSKSASPSVSPSPSKSPSPSPSKTCRKIGFITICT